MNAHKPYTSVLAVVISIKGRVLNEYRHGFKDLYRGLYFYQNIRFYREIITKKGV